MRKEKYIGYITNGHFDNILDWRKDPIEEILHMNAVVFKHKGTEDSWGMFDYPPQKVTITVEVEE